MRTLEKRSYAGRFVGLVGLLSLITVAFAAADESSGTWTGNLRLQGNYYWETSTRVVAPEVRGTLVSPDGVVISAGYLIDAITSASLAAGVIEDIRFTETRNQGSLSVGQRIRSWRSAASSDRLRPHQPRARLPRDEPLAQRHAQPEPALDAHQRWPRLHPR